MSHGPKTDYLRNDTEHCRDFLETRTDLHINLENGAAYPEKGEAFIGLQQVPSHPSPEPQAPPDSVLVEPEHTLSTLGPSDTSLIRKVSSKCPMGTFAEIPGSLDNANDLSGRPSLVQVCPPISSL